MRSLESFNLKEIITLYNGNGIYLVLFLVAVIYALIKLNKDQKTAYIYPVLVFGIIIFNPFTLAAFIEKLDGAEVFYRFIWVFPIIILIAYMFSEFFIQAKKRTQKFLVSGILFIILVTFGSFCLTNMPFSFPENAYRIPNETIRLAEMLHKYEKEPIVIMPIQHANLIREYDASIQLVYGRSKAIGAAASSDQEYNATVDYLYSVFVENVPTEPDYLKRAVQQWILVDFIIVTVDSQQIQTLTDAGFSVVGQTDHHLLFDCR